MSSSNLLMPADVNMCKTCGTVIPADKQYCSRVCFYNRNKTKSSPYVPLSPTEEDMEKEVDDPLLDQLVEEGIIDLSPEDEFCEVCGAPKYLGRCSRFTQHKAPKKPKSR